MINMDYFGISLWNELMMGDPDWLNALNLGTEDDFDPEGGLWDDLYSRLNQILTESGIQQQWGGCYHISSNIAQMMCSSDIFDIFPHYLEAKQKYHALFPIDMGLHISFSQDEYPLKSKFRSTFERDLDLAEKIGASAMVCHPPSNQSINQKEFQTLFINEITSKWICDLMRNSSVIIAWENMISGQYSSLRALVEFRNALCDRLKEIGYEDLISKHQLCFDTGHLMMWYAAHPSHQLAEQEISTYLPQFAQNLQVYHIHANDGNRDFHITPCSTEFFDHKTRSGIDKEKFLKNSERLLEWISICEKNKRLQNRHIHLENDKAPFSLEQIINFARKIK